MSDKEKIIAEIERMIKSEEEYIDNDGVYIGNAEGAIDMGGDIIKFIKSLPEEPVSNIWHDTNTEEPEEAKDLLLIFCLKDGTKAYSIGLYSEHDKNVFVANGSHYHWHKLSMYSKWAYIDDLLYKSKEPASKDLKEAAEKYGDELNNILVTAIEDDTSFGEYAQEAFKAGARWQRNRVWHAATEYPHKGVFIVALMKSGRPIAGEFDGANTNPENGLTAYQIIRKRDENKINSTVTCVDQWAYLEDITPINLDE